MISEEDALAQILNGIQPLGIESVPLFDAFGRFLAHDLLATIPLPGFDNSSMDGYAIAACTTGAQFRVTGEQPAGIDRNLRLETGDAIRIFTGAPVPQGTEAVVMQEDVTVISSAEIGGREIVVNTDVELGENIRRKGSDLCRGQRIAEAGEAITAPLAALFASQGMCEIEIGKRPRVSLLSTGDELIPPDGGSATLPPGGIYESNGTLLSGLLNEMGIKADRLGIAPDEAIALRERLKAGLESDVLIITGGVSVGERDLVKEELRNLGADLAIWRVAIKPGKPFLFGHLGKCFIFGLPGNPVSAFVTFLRFVRPAILKLQGSRELDMHRWPAVAGATLENRGNRPHYIRGRLVIGEVAGQITAQFVPTGRQESHALFGLRNSNALVRVPPDSTISAGEPLGVFTIG